MERHKGIPSGNNFGGGGGSITRGEPPEVWKKAKKKVEGTEVEASVIPLLLVYKVY